MQDRVLKQSRLRHLNGLRDCRHAARREREVSYGYLRVDMRHLSPRWVHFLEIFREVFLFCFGAVASNLCLP